LKYAKSVEKPNFHMKPSVSANDVIAELTKRVRETNGEKEEDISID